jgi:hypothetical protein
LLRRARVRLIAASILFEAASDRNVGSRFFTHDSLTVIAILTHTGSMTPHEAP